MSVIPFPPRHAAEVLAEALKAACEAASATAFRRHGDLFEPWGARVGNAIRLEAEQETAMQAMQAASPFLRKVTRDEEMVAILAHGMAEEAMIRLRKRGAA
jgi:hypothetical protein